MKIFKFIFFMVLAFGLIAGTVIFIVFETFDTDQFLPLITKKASIAIGRPVSIEHLGLGISSRGITLDAGPVTIADDPNFTTQPFIKVERVRISLEVKPLIFQREIHIKDILFLSPRIHFIRSQEGNLNSQSLWHENRGQLPILLERKSEKNRALSPVLPSPKSELSPILNRVSIKSIRIRDAAISFIDQNQSMPLDIWLTNINARLKDVSLSKPFRLLFKASLYSNTPNVQGTALISLPYGGDLSKRSVLISEVGLHTDFSHVDNDALKGISLHIQDSPVLKNITGVLQLNVARLEIGDSGNFKANGDLTITGVIIKNFSIIKTVLSQTLGAFGGMEDNMNKLLRGQLKEKLDTDDTVIKKAEAKFSIHDKTVFIDESLIQTDILEFSAKGSLNPGLNIDMQTLLHLDTDVSSAFVNELGGLKYFMDDSKRIAINAGLKGVFPHLKYKPDKDFKKKSRKMFIEEGGSILGLLLGGGGQSSKQTQDTGKKSRNILKNLLQ